MKYLLPGASILALLLSPSVFAQELSSSQIPLPNGGAKNINDVGLSTSTPVSSTKNTEDKKISDKSVLLNDVKQTDVTIPIPSSHVPASAANTGVTSNAPISTEKTLTNVNANPKKSYSDIYDVKLNNNWQFSGLITFENNKLFIPLKFLPSDLLGNITQNFFVDRNNSRFLEVPMTSVVKQDTEGLTIEINLTEDYFKTQLVSTSRMQKKDSVAIDALYMNYDVNFSTMGLNATRGTFDFNWASKDNWVLKNGFLWDGAQAVRLNTTWQKNNADNSTLILGDTSGNALSGFNSLSFLGFRYATSYYNNSLFLENSLPTIPISGFAVNPTRLDLYMNNQIVQQSEIASGKYNLNIPFQNRGYGVAQAVVYDITGKPNVVTVPFYSNSEILKKGANEYDVSGGFARKNYGTNSFSYDTPVLNGLYKGGWFNNYTQDLYASISPIYSAGSALAHFVPHPQVGMVNLGLSYNSMNQSLSRIGIERVTQKASFGIDYQTSDKFCFGFDQLCLKKQKQIFGGFSLPGGLGSLNLSYVSRETDTGKNNVTSVQWNKQITKNMSLFANASNITGTGVPNKTIYVGLSISFDSHIYTNSSISRDNTGSSFQQGIYRSEDDKHPEYGYGSLTYNKNVGDATKNVYYGARLRNFSYQTNIYQDRTGTTGNLDVSGGVAYIPEANYITFTKQIQSGLAYVNIENLTVPAEISHENRFSGYSDNKGRYLVPDAISLNNETISIDINKIPKGITLDHYKKEFYVPFSGATRVDFKAKPLPYVVKINGVKPGAIFNIDKDYYVVGDNGLTSLDNIGKAVLPLEHGETCTLEFTNKQKEYTCTPKADH